MAFFPAVPQSGRDVYGNDVPTKNKKGDRIWSKSVDTDESKKKKKHSKEKALKKAEKMKKGTDWSDYTRLARIVRKYHR